MIKNLKGKIPIEIFFALYLFGFIFLSAQTQDTLKSDTTKAKRPYEIGEEVIRGEKPYLITERKIFAAPRFNPFLLIEERLKPAGYIYDEKLYYTIDSLTIPSLFISSNYLRVPVKKRFIYGDVLILFPHFERTVTSWRLIIFDSQGEEVKRMEKRGMPPATVIWDGRKNTGEVITPGEIYSFSFSAYDAIGNETKIFGEPLKIPGIFYEEKGEKIIAIAAREVFQEGGQELTPQAKEILDEAANLVKENFKKEITCFVYSHKEELLPGWVEIMEKELQKRILLPKGAIATTPRFLPGLAPKYSKIEIIIN
ncbi:MAG: FlgD immunoglobulin-like domain containing protein [candidate division WOR-3 bacterium]